MINIQFNALPNSKSTACGGQFELHLTYDIPMLLIFSDLQKSYPLYLNLTRYIARETLCDVIVLSKTMASPFIHDLKLSGANIFIVPSTGSILNLKTMRSVYFLIKKSRPNSILISGTKAQTLGIILGYILGVPKRCFIRHYNSAHHKWNRFHWYLIDLLVNFLATEIICVSSGTGNILVSKEFVSRQKLYIIGNSIDLELLLQLRESKSVDSYPSKNPFLNILMITRLVKEKGIETAIEAFESHLALFPNSKLRIIGQRGELSDFVDSKLALLPLGSAELITEGIDVVKSLKWADVLIHIPTSPKAESFGMVFIEGLAAGVECVFTRSGVLMENQSDNLRNFYWEVSFLSSNSVSNALESISAGYRRNLDQKGLDLKAFSIDTILKRYAEFLLLNGFLK